MRILIVAMFALVLAASGQADASDTATPRDTAQAGATRDPEFLNSPEALKLDRPFSEAVRAGDFLVLSGQIGDDRATGKLVPGGIKAEATQTIKHIAGVLDRNGASLRDVVKCTVFLADISEWAAFNEVYRQFFSSPYPARSALGANGLAMNARVELECIAYKPK
jgi:2-iminobutanoate/2-iminopropanoate deaminase